MAKAIHKIFRECLIKDNNSYLYPPIRVGEYFFDASVINKYRLSIYCIALLDKVNDDVTPEEIYKLILLLNAVTKFDNTKEYKLSELKTAYNYRMIDKEINFILKYTNYKVRIKDINRVHIINESSEIVEAQIKDISMHDYLGYSITGDFDNERVDVQVKLSDNDDLVRCVNIYNKINNTNISFEYGKKNNFTNIIINDNYKGEEIELVISPNYFELHAEREGDETREDIIRHLEVASVINEETGENKYYLEMKEQFNTEVNFGNTITMKDDYIIADDDENKFYSIDDYNQTIFSIMNHPRNIEFLNRVLDESEKKFGGIREFLLKKYPMLNNAINGINQTNEIAVNAVKTIYNSKCNFGNDTLFAYDSKKKKK